MEQAPFDLNGSAEQVIGYYANMVYRLAFARKGSKYDADDIFQEVSTGYPVDQLSVFDLNVDDDFTELVLLSGENKDEDFVYNSYFFRYTKDGRLLYLGMTTGDVLNPTVSVTALETRS